MKNQRGASLIETLAVVILLSIVSIFLFSTLTSGFKNFDRTSTKQKLQQEGNYITEVVRNEYLKSDTTSIELKVDNTEKELYMNGSVISSGYFYTLGSSPANTFSENGPLHLVITISQKENGPNHEINTTLTKLE